MIKYTAQIMFNVNFLIISSFWGFNYKSLCSHYQDSSCVFLHFLFMFLNSWNEESISIQTSILILDVIFTTILPLYPPELLQVSVITFWTDIFGRQKSTMAKNQDSGLTSFSIIPKCSQKQFLIMLKNFNHTERKKKIF